MPKRVAQRSETPSYEQPAQTGGTEPAIRASDLEGLKFFKKIRPLLDSLHHVGTARDRAANRDLHMDQYGVLVLMWMFNPILTSGIAHEAGKNTHTARCRSQGAAPL